MMMLIIIMIMDQLLDQASSYERGWRTCFLSGHRATAHNQVSRNAIWEENESNKLSKQRPAQNPTPQILSPKKVWAWSTAYHSIHKKILVKAFYTIVLDLLFQQHTLRVLIYTLVVIAIVQLLNVATLTDF